MNDIATANEELPELESVHWTAIVSIVVGLLSPVALLGPLWWFIPILGATTGIVALRCVDPSYRKPVHRVIPAIGIVLSLLFGAWGPTRHLSRTSYVGRQSEEFGRLWISLIQKGRIKEAHQLCMPPDRRAADMRILEEMYKTQDNLAKLYRSFEEESFVREISELGETALIRHDGLLELQPAEYYDTISQNFTVEGQHGPKSKSIALTVVLRRLPPGSSHTSNWEVASFRVRTDF